MAQDCHFKLDYYWPEAKGIGQEWIILGNAACHRDSLRCQRLQAQRTVRPPLELRKQSWWPGVAGFAEWRVLWGPAPVLSPPWGTPWPLRPECGTLRPCSSWKLFYTSLQLITNSLKFILWVKWDHGYGVVSTVSSKTLFICPAAAGKKVLARTQNEWVNVGPLRKGDSAHLLVFMAYRPEQEMLFTGSRNCCCYWNNPDDMNYRKL